VALAGEFEEATLQEETNRLAFWKVSKLSPRTELRGTPATRALIVFAEGNDYKQKTHP